MNGPPILLGARRAARRRAVLDTAAVGAPLILAAAVAGWRLSGPIAATLLLVLGLIALAVVAWRRARRYGDAWLIGRLDARVPGFEDSSDLLFLPAEDGLAGLQRQRLEARIAQAVSVDLGPRWSIRAIAVAWTAGLLIVLAALFWPASGAAPADGRSPAAAGSAAGPPRITATRLRIIPPAYTGLPARTQTALDARVPEGSRIEWSLGFTPRPGSVALDFPDADPVRLSRRDETWTGARVVDRSLLYRIEARGLPRHRLNRLDAVADAPPEIHPVSPDSQLETVTPGQRVWTPVFEATDDYGVQASATLRITVTKGDGENITFTQRAQAVAGRGEAKRKRYAATLNLAREGLAPGGDLIVQLVVADNRSPNRQTVEGPSVILRWPADLPLADGLDGMLQQVLPAYFRSQRQIIIDAEALIAQRRALEPTAFMTRSNGLGVDQAQLRQRYGQFMGGENEPGGSALPTSDAAPSGPALPTNDGPAPPAAEEHHADDGHDHSGGAGLGANPSEMDVVSQFGHLHDEGEASTLFDPGTRSTLAMALDAMWGSERALRIGRPEDALPYANRALELLKQAQQATRIYLARTGPNLPPIDLSRRLSGEREDIVADPLSDVPPRRADAVPAEAWRALEERPGAPPLRLDALDGWVRANRARIGDPLALTAAIDTVRNEPGCLPCRRRLRALLWTALDRPPAGVRRRPAADARGSRYMDALR